MIQLNLFGKTPKEILDEENRLNKIKQDEERAKYQMLFFTSELERIKKIKSIVESGNGIIRLDLDCDCDIEFVSGEPLFLGKENEYCWLWLKKKFLGEWWYCNHIKGWNNNTPHGKEMYIPCTYDNAPQSEIMADTYRNCFISVEREDIGWDRDYCLERLTMAISCYEKNIRGESSIIEVEEEEEKPKQLNLLQMQGGTNQ